MLFNFWKFQFQLFHRNLVKKVSFWSNTKLRQSESWTHDKLISCVKLLLQQGLQLIFNQSCTLGFFHRYWLQSMWAPSFHRSVSFQPLEKRKEDMLKSRRGHNCEQPSLSDERLCCFIFSTFSKGFFLFFIFFHPLFEMSASDKWWGATGVSEFLNQETTKEKFSLTLPFVSYSSVSEAWVDLIKTVNVKRKGP